MNKIEWYNIKASHFDLHGFHQGDIFDGISLDEEEKWQKKPQNLTNYMNPKNGDEFEQYFWKDKTFKCIELPPDRDLNKELKQGFSNETIQRLAGEIPIFGATTDE